MEGGWEWSPGPLCGPDKVRKLRLEWEEAQQPGPFPTGGGLGTAEPGRRDHSLYGNGMPTVTLTGQPTPAAPGDRGCPVLGLRHGGPDFSLRNLPTVRCVVVITPMLELKKLKLRG